MVLNRVQRKTTLQRFATDQHVGKTLSLSLSLSHTHTHTHTHSLSLSYTHTHSLSLSLSHTHTHTLTLSLSLSLSHTHTHTLTLSLSPEEKWSSIQRESLVTPVKQQLRKTQDPHIVGIKVLSTITNSLSSYRITKNFRNKKIFANFADFRVVNLALL